MLYLYITYNLSYYTLLMLNIAAYISYIIHSWFCGVKNKKYTHIAVNIVQLYLLLIGSLCSQILTLSPCL